MVTFTEEVLNGKLHFLWTLLNTKQIISEERYNKSNDWIRFQPRPLLRFLKSTYMVVIIVVSIFCNYGEFIYEVKLQRSTKFSKISYCRVSNCFLKDFMQNDFIYMCGSAKGHIIPAVSEQNKDIVTSYFAKSCRTSINFKKICFIRTDKQRQ